jgi:polyribonucleotide nucleotidyltransferase
MRKLVLTKKRRVDGRGMEDIRPIGIETSLLPGAHGSALFTRGETQTLATATLGTKSMEARVETVDGGSLSKRFYLQYRFPPSAVGETGRAFSLSRREVGHGNLAERALLPSLPLESIFPYSIRAESLVTESCGSSR